MKKLDLEEMEIVTGGMSAESTIGVLCGATVVFALSGIFAPFAGATGVGCAVGLYALSIWD